MVDKIAEILQVNVPSPEALREYFKVFETIPRALLRESFRRVRNSHRYPNFPKIADFIKAIEPELEDHRTLYVRLKMIPRLLVL